MLKNFSDFDQAFIDAKEILDKNLKGDEWLDPLKKTLSKTLEKSKETNEVSILKNAIFDWMSDIEFEYIDIVTNEIAGLQGLTEAGMDINAPHMQWVIKMDQAIKEAKANHPNVTDINLFDYCFWHKESGIDPDDFQMLKKNREQKGHFALEMSQYIKWYVKSLESFESNRITIDRSREFSVYADKLMEGNDVKQEHLTKSLSKRFKVHPVHRELLTRWVESYLTQREKELDESGPGLN